MYAYYQNKDTKEDTEVKEPDGVAVSHVDDVLYAGNANFINNVIEPLKTSFQFGTEEEIVFRYVGMNIKKDDYWHTGQL